MILYFGAILSLAGSALRSVGTYAAQAGGAVLRAAVSPSGQAILKGALDLGVGVLGGLGQRSPSGVGSAAGLSLGNPLAVNRGPYSGATAYTPGINPNVSLGRAFPTVGDFAGGPQMGLLGAPVLTAARSALGSIATSAGRILSSTTGKAAIGGALGSAAIEAASGGFGVGMPGGQFVTGATARPIRRIWAQHPTSGQMVAWEYAGTPVLWSRDLAVARRVARIMGRPSPRGARRGRRRFR